MKDISMWGDKIVNREIIRPKNTYVITCDKIYELEKFNEAIIATQYSKDGVYIKDHIRPIIMFGESVNINGKNIIINSINDFIKAIETSNTPINIDSKIFTRNNIKTLAPLLTDLPGCNLGYLALSLYIESRIMINEHIDGEVILSQTDCVFRNFCLFL